MQDPTATITALKAGGGLVGAGILYAAAAVSDLPVPSPTVHGAFEMLMLTLMGWVITELKKKPKDGEERPKETPSGEAKSPWVEIVLSKLEDLAFGTHATANELKAHRIEFASHASSVLTRLDGIDNWIEDSKREKKTKDTGETKRP